VNVVFAWWLDGRYKSALMLLGWTLAVMRSELLLLAAAVGLTGLVTRRISLLPGVGVGLVGCVIGIGMCATDGHACLTHSSTHI